MRTARASVTPDLSRHVGVIGESGVGKSSLLNALISERLPLLPQGGIGPLTALPIQVCHSKTPYLKVACFGAARVRAMLEACTRYSHRSAQAASSDDESLFRLATLVASGSQFSGVAVDELLQFLRACLGDEGVGKLQAEMAARIGRVRRVIELGDRGLPLEIEAGTGLRDLIATLAEHGSGSLAPLTAHIELGWEAPVLADNLVLVDLPGLGVANDIHPLHTAGQISSLPGILLVVDRSGITESSAAALRHAIAEHVRAPPALIIAATKLDESAAAEVAVLPRGAASWREICSSMTHRVQKVLRSQLANEVSRLRGRSTILARALERAEIVAVFPREYQRLHRRDPEEPSRFKDPIATGIPELVGRLRNFAKRSAT